LPRDLPALHSLATHHWPLATVPVPLFSLYAPPVTRPTPHAPPAGSGRAQTFPRWLLPSTDNRIVKDRTGPDLDERPVHIQYVTEIQQVTEPGNFFGQIDPVSPRSPPPDRRPFSRGRWRSTRVALGVPAGWPSAAKPAHSLLSTLWELGVRSVRSDRDFPPITI